MAKSDLIGTVERVGHLCSRHSSLDSLLVRVGVGDVDALSALSTLYDEMSRTVYWMSMSSGLAPSCASQVTHDVFLRAWQRASSFDPGTESAWAWVRGIAIGTINDL